jgi:predicted DNA binding CopG/RHH family protein
LHHFQKCHTNNFRPKGNAQGITDLSIRCCMRKEYDFTAARKNPYASQLKKQITIRLDEESIDYFKSISEQVGIPYQSLINLYLRDCATSHRKLNLNWK